MTALEGGRVGRSVLRAAVAAAMLALLPGAMVRAASLGDLLYGIPFEPEVDAKAIIGSSYNFLPDREPQMSEAEFAIYRQAMTMLRRRPELALGLLEDATRDENSSAAFNLALGNFYHEQQRLADAERLYREAVRKYPSFTRAWENLGVLYYSTGRFAEAAPCLSRVAALGSPDARNLGLLGFCLVKTGNLAVAELAFLQACTLEPDNPDWLEGVLHVVLQSRQFARAEMLLRQLTRLRPKEKRHWMYLANVLIAEDRKLDAIVALDIAAGLGVLETDGLQLLGDLYAEERLYPEALRTYELLFGKEPETGAERMLRFVRVLAETGEHEAAGKLLARLEPLVPPARRRELLETRAAWLIASGRWEEAGTVLESILALDPLDGAALLDLAEAQVRQGEEVRAALTLESAARVPEVAYPACLRLAQIRVKLRQYKQALAALEQALRTHEAPLVREYVARVKALAALTTE